MEHFHEIILYRDDWTVHQMINFLSSPEIKALEITDPNIPDPEDEAIQQQLDSSDIESSSDSQNNEMNNTEEVYSS